MLRKTVTFKRNWPFSPALLLDLVLAIMTCTVEPYILSVVRTGLVSLMETQDYFISQINSSSYARPMHGNPSAGVAVHRPCVGR